MDPLYERYASTHAGAEELGSLHVVLARDLLPLLPDRGARCLDLGCGQGGLVAYLRQHGYDNAFGVDISPEQVAVARSLGRDYVAEGDVLATLAESSESWEVLTAFDFFEHLDRQHVVDTLIAARRTLPPGGRLIARVPNAAGPLYGAIQYGDFTHRSHFTQRSLRQLTQVAGFEEVIVLETPPPVHGVVSALRRSIWSAYAGLHRVAMAAETGRVRGHLVTSNIMAVFVA